MTRRRLLIDAEVHAHLGQLPHELKDAFVDICADLVKDPVPPDATGYGGIPTAYSLTRPGLVIYYTVEPETLSIWRVRVNR